MIKKVRYKMIKEMMKMALCYAYVLFLGCIHFFMTYLPLNPLFFVISFIISHLSPMVRDKVRSKMIKTPLFFSIGDDKRKKGKHQKT